MNWLKRGLAMLPFVSQIKATSRNFSGFVQHTANPNRRKRRALVKAVGIRQFKKLYRAAKV